MAKEFDHASYLWKKGIDYRKNPEAYFVGKGEQGVLICEPYLSEILPFWKFRTPEIASISSQKITDLFYEYLKNKDFIGADLARKFLQMGFTRSRRYANYKGGRKYKNDLGDTFTKGSGDTKKIESANIFFAAWKKVEQDLEYQTLKKAWQIKDKLKMEEKKLKKGTVVTYKAPQGKVEGKVVKKITKAETVTVGEKTKKAIKASKEDPKYLVKSSKSGKQAVHKGKSLKT